MHDANITVLIPVSRVAVGGMRRQNMDEHPLVQVPCAAAKAFIVDNYETAVADCAQRIRFSGMHAGDICCGETQYD